MLTDPQVNGQRITFDCRYPVYLTGQIDRHNKLRFFLATLAGKRQRVERQLEPETLSY